MFFNYLKSEKLKTVIICHTQKRRDINPTMSEQSNAPVRLKRAEFADFLKARRAAVQPFEVRLSGNPKHCASKKEIIHEKYSKMNFVNSAMHFESAPKVRFVVYTPTN